MARFIVYRHGAGIDAAREARVRRMVPDPTTWPQRGYLCMKRYDGNQPVEFGNLQWLPSGRIAISCDLPAEALYLFENVDDLITAGWAVD